MFCRRQLPCLCHAPAVLVFCTALWLTGCATSSSLSSSKRPDAGSAYTRLGLAYLEQNNLQRALNALDRAEQLNPDSPETLQALALVYQRQGEDDLAARQFQQALEADADFTRARNNYAAFLYQQGQYQRACEQLKIAAQDTKYAHRARLFTNLGQCYAALDQIQRARDSFIRAGEINPRQARSHWLLARLEFSQGHHDRAWPALQRFLQLGRPTQKALEMAVELARERGDTRLAERYRRRLDGTGEAP